MSSYYFGFRIFDFGFTLKNISYLKSHISNLLKPCN
jgi:hypothetical protein